MIPLEIEVDPKGALFWIDFAHKQTAFGLMIALNRTAELALAEERKAIQRNFIVRAPGFILPPLQIPNAHRATKTRLAVAVKLGYEEQGRSIGNRRAQILSPFEEGTPKRGRLDMPIAIPTKAVRPDPRGLIPQRMYPRNLIGNFSVLGRFVSLGTKAREKRVFKKHKGTTKVFSRQVGRYFTMDPRQQRGLSPRAWGVWERTGPGTRDIRLLWAFRIQVPRPARLTFHKTAQESVDRNFGREWELAFDFAMRTAS